MKFGRSFQQETEGIPLAPLIDIVFLMLVFFMTTAVYSNIERSVDIQLPTASSAQDVQRTSGEILINVTAEGSIILNDRVVTVEELQEILNRVAEHFPGGAVTIRSDRAAQFGVAVRVLDCCKNADIPNINIAALREEPEES